MSLVYMIRHGKPAATWGEHLDADPGLDIEGRKQAEVAADALAALPAAVKPGAVFTSPLRRCIETAAPFAKILGSDATVEPAVAEIPAPSHLSHSERGPWLRAAFTTTWDQIPGEIDYALWRDRVAEAVARHQGAAIFSHFVAINAAVSAATGDPAVLSFQPDHASITIFEVKDGVLSLVERGRSASTKVL